MCFGKKNIQELSANPSEGRHPIIRSNFPENCMKMRKMGKGARPQFVYIDPPMVNETQSNEVDTKNNCIELQFTWSFLRCLSHCPWQRVVHAKGSRLLVDIKFYNAVHL